jgi:hypothetical protein
MKQSTKRRKIIIYLLTVVGISLGLWGILWTGEYVFYYYNDVVLDNRITRLVSCNEFPGETEMQQILRNNQNEYIQVANRLKSMNADITYGRVGPRCLSKYQFTITFPGHTERVTIEKEIINEGKLFDVPVQLINL